MKRARRIVESDEEEDSGLYSVQESEPGANEYYSPKDLQQKHNFSTFVERMETQVEFREAQIKTYGRSKETDVTCPRCKLEFVLNSKGIIFENGKSRLIVEDEEFTECPNCSFKPNLYRGDVESQNELEDRPSRKEAKYVYMNCRSCAKEFLGRTAGFEDLGKGGSTFYAEDQEFCSKRCESNFGK